MTGPARYFSGEHNHVDCISKSLRRAEEICRKRKVRLTPLRRRVLELVCESHRAIGAYDILEKLQEKGRAAPPTVYRALDFLQGQGLVHRLASLNAYVGCVSPDTPHPGQFLICESCRTLVELNDNKVSKAISRSAREAGFQIKDQTVENVGLCPRCR